MVKLGDALGYDKEVRIPLIAGVTLNITKFSMSPAKRGKWINSRIDSINSEGKITYYHATGVGISGVLSSLEEQGIDGLNIVEPIECVVITKVSETNGLEYLSLE